VTTPRRTRLVRVADLQGFRNVLTVLSLGELEHVRTRIVVVPTRNAARQLVRTLEARTLSPPSPLPDDSAAGRRPARALLFPDLATREQLYDRLRARLPSPPRRLTPFEREVLLSAAAQDAIAGGAAPSFRLRPGLVAEILRFYDQLCRQGQTVTRFEEILEHSLARDAEFDRGTARMLQQTRFLAATFQAYRHRVAATAACDEHGLRERLVADRASDPIRDIVVGVADWIADPNGLHRADFDLLTRLPDLECITIVATEALLGSGFHQRIHNWLPGLDEVDAASLGAAAQGVRPVLDTPAGSNGRLWFVSRDREEELIGIARRLKADLREASSRVAAETPALDRRAIVFKQPLPYLYLARDVFGKARVSYQASDALPLAAEPYAAALDLVLEFVTSGFARGALVALLRSPHFAFEHGGQRISSESIGALDRALSEARYLGDLDRLAALAATWLATGAAADAPRPWQAEPALRGGLAAAMELSPLQAAAPASKQIERLLSFLTAHASVTVVGHEEFGDRHWRTRTAILGVLEGLAAAYAAHDDRPCNVGELAATIHRWIEEETFVPGSDASGLQLLDAQAVRYGDFDVIDVVGLVEGEWPERRRRNIFYPLSLLASLGWPSERERRGGAEAAFLDLLSSASRRVSLSTFMLDEEALVDASMLVDHVSRAHLVTVDRDPIPPGRISIDEALSLDPPALDILAEPESTWARMRTTRSSAESPVFHGQAGARQLRPLSVSAIDTYLECPFRFFAKHELQLEEESGDEEVMDPRKRGHFMHGVFEEFFSAWQESGHGGIAPESLPEARELFAEVLERRLVTLPGTEATLERTRLLGSLAATGLGEAVLRMEAERPATVVARLLEHRLVGNFEFDDGAGRRTIALKGKADRLDLLADGTFRLIDYKLGRPPNPTRALQLPVYALCAEQQLAGHLGRSWTLGEAAYIAFGGPKRIVPLFSSPMHRHKVLADAQVRLVATTDAIAQGAFPPRPDSVRRCGTCSYSSVCRKDYVGDV
jgi:ATP-dependent helicase/nuclease subunit B